MSAERADIPVGGSWAQRDHRSQAEITVAELRSENRSLRAENQYLRDAATAAHRCLGFGEGLGTFTANREARRFLEFALARAATSLPEDVAL
jgi:hypothetical protein